MSLGATQLGLFILHRPFQFILFPMTPQINSAFQRLPIDTQMNTAQVAQFKSATKHLIYAVEYATTNEMAMLQVIMKLHHSYWLKEPTQLMANALH